MDSLDEILDLFRPERRRFALYYLDEADEPVPKEDLAQQIEQWESDPSGAGPPENRYDEMVIALEHEHLPRIADADHVEFEYDRESEQLRITDLSTEADIILSVTRAIEHPSKDASTDIPLGE